jgi:two-component system cell cycle response regulator DivK
MTASPLLLIVEDNAQNLKLARDILAHVGYGTLEAQTAEQAVALARSHRPDMILMDIQLPGMDGIQALAQLQADAVTAAIPVVAFTAFAMKDDRERFLGAGFHGYLEKPISVRDFPGQVADLLASANARAQT